MTDHDHTGHGAADACPLCPDDARLAEMRTRNRAEAEARRTAVLAAMLEEAGAWTFLVEASDGDGQDVVMHVASTLPAARRWCETGTHCNRDEVRLSIIPHRIDDGEPDHRLDASGPHPLSGHVRLAVYGRRPGSDLVQDLVGTDDEWPKRADDRTATNEDHHHGADAGHGLAADDRPFVNLVPRPAVVIAITGIEWDVDADPEDAGQHPDLPIDLHAGVPADWAQDHAYVDLLSDHFGYCIKGVSGSVEEVDHVPLDGPAEPAAGPAGRHDHHAAGPADAPSDAPIDTRSDDPSDLGEPTGRTWPMATIVDMAMLPTDVLPRLLRELPVIVDGARTMLADIPGFAGELRRRAAFPARLLPVSAFEERLRRTMTTRATWTDDGVGRNTLTGRTRSDSTPYMHVDIADGSDA